MWTQLALEFEIAAPSLPAQVAAGQGLLNGATTVTLVAAIAELAGCCQGFDLGEGSFQRGRIEPELKLADAWVIEASSYTGEVLALCAEIETSLSCRPYRLICYLVSVLRYSVEQRDLRATQY